MKILNIAGGKISPIHDKIIPSYILNVDTSYYSDMQPSTIEQDMIKWEKDPDAISKIVFLNENIFTFIERTIVMFDRVCIYRFLEHISFTQIDYFIYLISTITSPGAIIDIIVPNYKVLSQILINEQLDSNFEHNNILLTTELLNQPPDPHASIWTSERACYFWELEKRFKVDKSTIDEKFKFDGRDIYLRFFAKRIE